MKKIRQLLSMCLGDFAPRYVSKKVDNGPIDPDEIKSCTVPLFNTVDDEPNPNIIVIKNEISKTWKCS